jgi:site-specific DNA-methyltransferase (cytosine-N4-specific)
MKPSAQLDLFSSVLHAYADSREGVLDNSTMYARALEKSGLPVAVLTEKTPVGKAQAPRSLVARKMRWYQQSLRAAGILERVEGERGVWGLTKRAGKDLSQIQSGVAVVGFSTDLGIMILGSCDTVFSRIDSPITLVLTSPPYPLAQARSYGNVSEAQYVDWIVRMIEPLVKNLVRGGSIALNISNDIFLSGSPARSLYRERLVLALHDKLGLYKVDELIWRNPSKAPGPIQWASLQRVQLNVEWEPVYWFTNDPSCLLSDNRRVRTAHTERHLKLIAQGGEQRVRANSDGAYRIRQGAYGNATEGRIPRNVLTFGHACADQRAYKRMAREQGLPAHGAAMPLSLASFLIEFMSQPGDLVVDPFGGSGTTGRAAQRLGRRWMMTDVMAEYVLGAANRFRADEGFQQLLVA